ncbi:MAG: flippase-like domain-containing protein, partial [Leptospiraceae bacterium]|nr:flippase-like domain-containing protein [Leptospiraceae bacterium]
LGTVFFSIRWYYLLERQIKLKHAISSSFIGYGANMVLPARGGDLFRIYYSRAETGIRSLNLLSKLFIEKVIDFVSVILIGIVAFSIYQFYHKTSENSFAVFTFSGLIVFGMVATLYVIRYHSELILRILAAVGKKFKKEEFIEHHISVHIKEIKEFLNLRNFLYPIFYTIFTWLCYLLTHKATAATMNMELGYLELGFLLFCGAISLALPSAPSGVGVYHGSIISGFILLGLDAKQGFLFATAQHLITFVLLSVTGFLFYLYWMYRRKGKSFPWKHEQEDKQLAGE